MKDFAFLDSILGHFYDETEKFPQWMIFNGIDMLASIVDIDWNGQEWT